MRRLPWVLAIGAVFLWSWLGAESLRAADKPDKEKPATDESPNDPAPGETTNEDQPPDDNAEEAADEPVEKQIDPQADAVVRAACDFLKELKSYRCELVTTARLSMLGRPMEMESKQQLALRRPNRLALRAKEGEEGLTIVCDGKQIYRLIGLLGQQVYTVDEAPDDLDGLLSSGPESLLGLAAQGGMGGGGTAMFLEALFSSDPYERLMAGVHRGEHLGSEEVEGVKCHHLKFSQEEVDWEMWIEEGGQPLIRKLVPDMSHALAGALGGAFGDLLKGMKVESVIALNDWDVTGDLPDDLFQFKPPKGAKKVKSIMEGFPGLPGLPGLAGDDAEEGAPEQEEGEDPAHRLVGKEAPDFKLDVLDGEELDLARLKEEKQVVVLDFWATWCPPCRKGLPVVSKVAQEFAEQGVVLFAVNVDEEVDDIHAFLKESKLDVQVALDRGGKVAEKYAVTGIPQTVLIGKDGTVQVVHVGFAPDLEKELRDDLKALAAGEDLARRTLKPSIAKPTDESPADKPDGDEPTDETSRTEGLEIRWSVDGNWSGVATDAGQQAVYVLGKHGQAVELDALGKSKREFTLPGTATSLCRASLIAGGAPEFVTFRTWGPSVQAFDAAGDILWSYDKESGIDDVACADLDGDGLDEVVVGYNGDRGLHVLDSHGKLLWQCDELGNVWHVTVGDVVGDRQPEVVSTSATGQVHVFDRQGKRLQDYDVGCYANMVRAVRSSPHASSSNIVAGGMGDEGLRLEAIACEGERDESLWSLDLSTNQRARHPHIDAAVAATSRPWLAVATHEGPVFIVDFSQGKIVAQAAGDWKMADVAWLDSPEGGPLLLIATADGLTAFRVEAE